MEYGNLSNMENALGHKQEQWSPAMAAQEAQRQHQTFCQIKQVGNQVKQPGLMDGLRGAHDLIDRLNASLNGLEDRLSPLLQAEPVNQIGGIPPQPPSCEPTAIELLCGILSRLQMHCSAIDRISDRARV